MNDTDHPAIGRALTTGPSFPLANRVERAVWGVAWFVLGRWTPNSLNPWRRVLLRAFGAKVSGTAALSANMTVWLPRNLVLGDQCTIGPGAVIYNMALVQIGARAIISQRAHLCAGSHDIRSLDFRLIARPIAIGDDVWIAAEAFVGPGVIVAEGAVLGARGVAAKNLAPWSVYAGNPASKVGTRQMGVESGRGK